MKKSRKLIVIMLTVVLAIFTFGFGACFNNCFFTPTRVETDRWTYYILQCGGVALVELTETEVSPEGVLRFPNTIDGREVISLGMTASTGPWGSGMFFTRLSIPRDVQKVIVAEGLSVSFLTPLARIVEFECRNAANIDFRTMTVRNIIVPNGARDIYTAAIVAQRVGGMSGFTVLEKSESIGAEWIVDDEGLLLAYFGLEPHHLVLPTNIRKIGSGSFNLMSPQTIILNEGLEWIGLHALAFASSAPRLQTIKIPRSVQYIEFGLTLDGTAAAWGSPAIPAHYIYLYRNTTINYSLFSPPVLERIRFYE